MLEGLKDANELKRYEILHFTPFDPVHKRTEAQVKGPDGKTFNVSKGAPQVIVDLAGPEADVREASVKATEDFARRGFRSLGVARTDDAGNWRLVGILPLYDPPRPDSKQTLATAVQMGISPKMITGDQVAIAKETSRTLGLGDNIVDAQVFEKGDVRGEELGEQVEAADGFAQVFPEHKFKIIDILQKRNHIVGMTGDGVNDAPPLKKADAGIAVSNATDAARAAADISLLSPGLTVIIDAIKESRRIFQRMNSYAIYRIAETIRVLLFMTLAIVVFNFYPVTAIMIVILALLNDTAMLSIAYDNVRYSDRPERWNMHRVLTLATTLGTLGVLENFWPVLHTRPRVHDRPAHDPIAALPQTGCLRPLHYLRCPHLRAVLVGPTGDGPAYGGSWGAGDCDSDRGLWPVHDALRLEVGGFCVGILGVLVLRRRPRQAADLRLPEGRLLPAGSREEEAVVGPPTPPARASRRTARPPCGRWPGA